MFNLSVIDYGLAFAPSKFFVTIVFIIVITIIVVVIVTIIFISKGIEGQWGLHQSIFSWNIA